MSAEQAVQAAVRAALLAHPTIAAQANGVHGPGPIRASLPSMELGELVATDWGTKDADGRELRTRVVARAAGESDAAAQALADAIVEAVAGLPRTLAGGWSVGAVRLVRRRVGRERDGRWAAVIEHRLRVLQG